MKNIILNQRAERDELMARPYQQRDNRYNFEELLANPLIKLTVLCGGCSAAANPLGRAVYLLIPVMSRGMARPRRTGNPPVRGPRKGGVLAAEGEL